MLVLLLPQPLLMLLLLLLLLHLLQLVLLFLLLPQLLRFLMPLKPPKFPPEGVWGLVRRPEMLLALLANIPEGIFELDAETAVSAKVNESLAFVESWLKNSSSIFKSI